MFSIASHTPGQAPIAPTRERTSQYVFNSYVKVCSHCRTVYPAQHAKMQHCMQCATCGTYKQFSDMAGKAVNVGYVCSECYLSKSYVRQFMYTILLRL